MTEHNLGKKEKKMINILMEIASAAAVLSTAGIAFLAQASAPVDMGKSLGNFTASEILGVVAVLSIGAVVLLYRDSRKDNARLYKIIEDNARASQAAVESISHNSGVMVEVKDAILKCQQGAKEPK